jgi:hypothetical protein
VATSKHPLFILINKELDDLDQESGYLCAAQDALHKDLPAVHPQLDQIVYIAMASTIEKLYTGMEKCLQRIAANVDEFSPKGDSWHKDLIDQMEIATEDRPAVLSRDTANALHALRAFRHRERNIYGGVLERKRVITLSEDALALIKAFRKDIRQFEKAMSEE